MTGADIAFMVVGLAVCASWAWSEWLIHGRRRRGR